MIRALTLLVITGAKNTQFSLFTADKEPKLADSYLYYNRRRANAPVLIL